jgi:type I restriction enzyme, S subunit
MQLIDKHDSCPEGWTLTTVGEACLICDNFRLPLNVDEREQMQGQYPYYGPTGVLDHLNEYRLDGKYALIGEDGDHFLKYWDWPMTQLVEGQFNVNNHAHVVRGTNGCSTEWFYLFFHHMSLRRFLTLQGVGRYKLTRQALEGLSIIVPPLAEQERIVEIIGQWSDAITLTGSLISAKVRFKRGLMQQLLTGKRRFPEFKGEWKHEEIGHYLEECSSRVSATTSLPIYTSSRAGLKPQEDYYGGRKVINDGEYGVVAIDCFVFRHMSDDGLFVFHINQTGGDVAVSKEYPVFRAINLDRHFLLAKLNHSMDFKTFALSQKAGGTRTRLYFSKLRNWKTLLPSLPEQRRISEVLNAADREIDLLRRELHALKQQKKGLMQKLLTGQVRVKPSNGGD